MARKKHLEHARYRTGKEREGAFRVMTLCGQWERQQDVLSEEPGVNCKRCVKMIKKSERANNGE